MKAFGLALMLAVLLKIVMTRILSVTPDTTLVIIHILVLGIGAGIYILVAKNATTHGRN
jgi:hypothetical protein